MYSLNVDISEVQALTRAAAKELGAVPQRLKRRLDGVAKVERQTHKYRNRTYRLQGSTFALGPRGGTDYTSVELGMRMHYASYLWWRGQFSGRDLTRFPELSEEAETEVEFMFDCIGEALSKM